MPEMKQKQKSASRPARKEKKPFFASIYFWLKLALCLGLLFLWIPILLPSTIYSSADYGSVKEKVINVLDDSLYPLQDNQKFRRYLGLEPDDYMSIEFFRTDDAMKAEELLLVQFEQGQDLSSLKQAISTRISSQASIYEGYAPEQKALMDSAIQDYQGNFALYYVGDEPEKVDEIFQQALRE